MTVIGRSCPCNKYGRYIIEYNQYRSKYMYCINKGMVMIQREKCRIEIKVEKDIREKRRGGNKKLEGILLQQQQQHATVGY